jgi:hypothetical protein
MMASQQEWNTNLPIRFKLRLVYISSLTIAILVASASIAALLDSSTFYPTDEFLRSFVSNDVVNLVIGLPILLVSLWLTWRGKLIGLLLWPGALFFMLYNSLIYVLALPMNIIFLLHLAVVTICVYSLITLVASMDGKAIQQRLSGVVPERLGGAVLAGMGLLFFLQVINAIISALISQAQIAETDRALHTADFLITPAWIIGGVFLWKRKAFGYLTGLGLLFQASMLFVGLIVFLLLQPYLVAEPFALVDIVVVTVIGLICFLPFTLFVRGVITGHNPPPNVRNEQDDV